MDVYLALLLLTFIVVNLVDLSGFVDTVKHWIWRWVFGKNGKTYHDFPFKPFECSYCMSHHVGVIYLLIVGQFSILTYAYLLFLSVMTPVFKDILILVKAFAQKIIDTVFEWYDL